MIIKVEAFQTLLIAQKFRIDKAESSTINFVDKPEALTNFSEYIDERLIINSNQSECPFNLELGNPQILFDGIFPYRFTG